MMCGLPHLPAQHQHFRFIRRAFLAVLSLHHASTHMHSCMNLHFYKHMHSTTVSSYREALTGSLDVRTGQHHYW